VNSHESSKYRFELAQECLAFAETQAQDGHWSICLGYAQETVENAGKAILLQFRPVPRTHDIDELILDLTRTRAVPETIRKLLDANLDTFRGMGVKTHMRAADGDEEAHITPGKLIQEPEAQAGLAKARRAVALAQTILDEANKSAPI
jgi:HEPN domain-containing protein